MLAWTAGMCSEYIFFGRVTYTVYSMLKDERVARDEERSLFNLRDVSDRMG